MFRYQINAVNYFEGCQTLAEYLNRSVIRETWSFDEPSFSNRGQQQGDVIKKLITEAIQVFRDGYWEGDIIDHIYVLPLPPADLSDGCMDIGFIWKQRNNGTTFILSPRELPWLEENMIFPRQRVHIQHKGATITVSGDDAAFMAERINQMLTGKKP